MRSLPGLKASSRLVKKVPSRVKLELGGKPSIIRVLASSYAVTIPTCARRCDFTRTRLA
jgi:hypothetical protein